jgi:hypothetical protein
VVKIEVVPKKDVTVEDPILREKWVRKLMVCTLHDLGVTCPGICCHQIPPGIGGRHCNTLSRVLHKGTRSIFRALRRLAELGYVDILELSPEEGSEGQLRRGIQKVYRLSEKGKEKAKEFDDEFEYGSLL